MRVDDIWITNTHCMLACMPTYTHTNIHAILSHLNVKQAAMPVAVDGHRSTPLFLLWFTVTWKRPATKHWCFYPRILEKSPLAWVNWKKFLYINVCTLHLKWRNVSAAHLFAESRAISFSRRNSAEWSKVFWLELAVGDVQWLGPVSRCETFSNSV